MFKKFFTKKRITIIFYILIILLSFFLIFLNIFEKKDTYIKNEKIKREIEKFENLKDVDSKDTDGDGLED
jgi:hypothetical protein